MPLIKKIDVFDLIYNEDQHLALLTFDAVSDARPPEKTGFWFNGNICEFQRSPEERLLLEFKNEKAAEALCKAREVRVAEIKSGHIIWDYLFICRNKKHRSYSHIK